MFVNTLHTKVDWDHITITKMIPKLPHVRWKFCAFIMQPLPDPQRVPKQRNSHQEIRTLNALSCPCLAHGFPIRLHSLFRKTTVTFHRNHPHVQLKHIMNRQLNSEYVQNHEQLPPNAQSRKTVLFLQTTMTKLIIQGLNSQEFTLQTKDWRPQARDNRHRPRMSGHVTFSLVSEKLLGRTARQNWRTPSTPIVLFDACVVGESGCAWL